MSRKMPPKAAMVGWASTSRSANRSWSASLPSASSTADHGLMPALALTSRNGKTSRIPKTAIRMPTVRKIVCQNFDIRRRIVALMTALSNENEISRMRQDRDEEEGGEPGGHRSLVVVRVAGAVPESARETGDGHHE